MTDADAPMPAQDAAPADAPELNVNGPDFAALLAARLCHDFISPASAIVSGLDLLEDPESQDMREDAMRLITASARKLADHLAFARVAFGARGMEFEARVLDVFLIRGRHGQERAMAARLERLTEAQVRIEVAVRSE